MSPRTITLASPIEPSGASWLVNCFLELGIRVDHTPGARNLWRRSGEVPAEQRLWQRDGKTWQLHPRAAVLGKWMPTLVHRDRFEFRDDVVVNYVQDFPNAQNATETPVLFIRDPRDAIYSRYRRRQANMPFSDYIQFPNPHSLMPMADHWLLFAQCWRAMVGDRVYRFEDYKQDAQALLTRILADLHLDYAPQDIARAVENSSLDAAKAAEAIYRARHPGDWEVANRAGKVGDWQNREEIAAAVETIGTRCGALLSELGYEVAANVDDPAPRYGAQLRHLKMFNSVVLTTQAERVRTGTGGPETAPESILSVARNLREQDLKDAGYPPPDCRALLNALQEFDTAFDAGLSDHLAALHAVFADGASQHMNTLRDLMRQRREARKSP